MKKALAHLALMFCLLLLAACASPPAGRSGKAPFHGVMLCQKREANYQAPEVRRIDGCPVRDPESLARIAAVMKSRGNPEEFARSFFRRLLHRPPGPAGVLRPLEI